MSQMNTSYKNFSKDGFQPLSPHNYDDMSNPHDITIDIPMTQVPSKTRTGARKPGVMSPVHTVPSHDYTDSLTEKPSHIHFQRTPAGRRKKIEAHGKERKDSLDGSANALGKFYKKVYNFSVVTRYFFYVAPVALAIAIPIIVGATVAQSATIGGVRILWFFTWVEVVWCGLWISKLFAQFLPYVFQFLCGVVSPGTRKYALIISALEIPLSLVGWAAISLPTFVTLMTLNPDQRARGDTGLKNWEQIVKNILFACLFSTLVLFVEKLLVQLISISYHRKQFDDKIKDSKRNIYLISLLYDASRALFPAYCTEFAEEDYVISDVLDLGNSGLNSRHDHKRSGSNTPLRLIQKVGRVGDKVTSAFGNVAQEITGKQVFNPNAAHSVVIQALEKKNSSEALARRLWLSFVLEGRDALFQEDITDVLGSGLEIEAEEAFSCLDVDGNGDISLDEMVLRLGEFARERKSIASSMHDVDQAINVLDNLLCTVVFIATVFIFVAWLNTNFTTTLATTGTALLSLSFVFAATCQEVLGSCIFLFVKHPYDVGDRVDIGEAHYVVERISLLYTIFRRVNDHKRTQVPNIVLNTLWIDNVSRSKAMREQVNLFVSFDTTLEDVELLRDEMQKFVRDKDNARDFQSEVDIEVTGVADMSKLELKIEIRHKSNWANEVVRASRRSKFMCALVLALRKVPIYGPGGSGAPAGDKANPTYSVAISDAEAHMNKATFSHDLDKKRMTPLLPENATDDTARSTSINNLAKSTSSSKENSVLQGLNKRNPSGDPARDDDDSKTSLALERKRTNDLEEVRGILRRESTTGRRRASQSMALGPETTYPTRMGSQTIPRIAETSPMEPILPPGQIQASYFQGGPGPTMTTASSSVPPPIQTHYIPPPKATVPPASGARQSYSAGNESGFGGTLDPTMSRISTESPERPRTAGNAFAQQSQQQQYSTPSSQRRPLPGASEMKDYLTSPKR